MSINRHPGPEKKNNCIPLLAPAWAKRLSVGCGASACIFAIYGIILQEYPFSIGPGLPWTTAAVILGLASCYYFRVSQGIATHYGPDEMAAAQTMWKLRSLGLGDPSGHYVDKPSAVQLLTATLPMIEPEHANRLSLEQVESLRCYLVPNRVESSPYLIAEVIRALERIGDGGAYFYVKQMCGDDIIEPVRGIARRALPQFKRLFDERKANGRLLRASDITDYGSALLRLPSDELETDASQLLRPTIESRIM
jgi:hypothetical protein